MKNNIDVSIVVPVYKSTRSLEILTQEIAALQNEIDTNFELIFVNDSPFFLETNKVLETLDLLFEFVKVVTLRKNQGQHMALLVGLSKASGEFVVTMDDDLQHPVNEIPKLISAIAVKNGPDAVFAIPFSGDKKHSPWRNFGSYVINKADVMFLSKPAGLRKSPFRIMRHDLVNVIVNNYNSSPAVSSLIIRATNNIVNIEVEHKDRQFGKSGYSVKQLMSLTLNNILHYSSLPLKLLGYVGAFGFICSIIFIITVLIRKLFFDINFPGYASIVSLISLFGGLNLLALGIIGEYLIRIVKEQQKPGLDSLYK